jgi:septal ring factor EnvC (AmiA/AmiB activator)
MWRALKATGKRLGDGLDEISTAVGAIETHLSLASESSQRLAAMLDRLRRSRARLEVQLAAVREARQLVLRAVPFIGGR